MPIFAEIMVKTDESLEPDKEYINISNILKVAPSGNGCRIKLIDDTWVHSTESYDKLKEIIETAISDDKRCFAKLVFRTLINKM